MNRAILNKANARLSNKVWRMALGLAILLALLIACFGPFDDSDEERDREEQEGFQICLLYILSCRNLPEGTDERNRNICDRATYFSCGGANRL